MTSRFDAACRPLLIGSLPLKDHVAASRLVFQYTPDIPLWVQLPEHAAEGMISQFMPGMPGTCTRDGRTFVDTAGPDFAPQLLAFYEEHMSVTEEQTPRLDRSRFSLSNDVAPGFAEFLQRLSKQTAAPTAVKCQVSGPLTFCTGLKDERRQAIFYDPQLRDVAVKL